MIQNMRSGEKVKTKTDPMQYTYSKKQAPFYSPPGSGARRYGWIMDGWMNGRQKKVLGKSINGVALDRSRVYL